MATLLVIQFCALVKTSDETWLRRSLRNAWPERASFKRWVCPSGIGRQFDPVPTPANEAKEKWPFLLLIVVRHVVLTSFHNFFGLLIGPIGTKLQNINSSLGSMKISHIKPSRVRIALKVVCNHSITLSILEKRAQTHARTRFDPNSYASESKSSIFAYIAFNT